MKTLRSHLYALLATTLLCASLLNTANAGTLISTVDRNRISTNETLTLSVKYDQQVDGSKLGLGILESDFEILSASPQTSSSTSIINGKVSKEESTIWRVVLAPKREGKLTIPALSVNGDQSQAITIDVQAGAIAGSSDNPFSALISANSNQIYPGQQLIIEVELSAAADVTNFGASEFQIDNADIEVLAQNQSQRLENGLVRQIIVLRYAVFAKQAGTLTVPPLTFTASQGGRRSFFDSRPGKRVLARTSALQIEVTEKDLTKSPWFPADNVSITARWSGDVASMTVGEPMTRTVVVTARGQKASVIPPLAVNSSAQYKSYKDQAQLDDGKTETGYVATRIESEAIVASKAGPLTLPEQRISWWDVKSGQWKEAILPSQTINVAENTSINNDQSIQQVATQTAPQTVIQTKTHWIWPAVCALLVLLCLLQTWIIWQLKKRPNVVSDIAEKPQNLSEPKQWKALEKALATSDVSSVRHAIINWGQSNSTELPLNTLDKIASVSNDQALNQQLKQAFNELERSLFKTDSTSVDLNGLAELMTSLRSLLVQHSTNASDKGQLKPLYKA